MSNDSRPHFCGPGCPNPHVADTPRPERYRIETGPFGVATIVRNADNRSILNVMHSAGSAMPHFADRSTAERILAFLNADHDEEHR